MYYYNPDKLHLKILASILLIVSAIAILVILLNYSQAARVDSKSGVNTLQSYAKSKLNKLIGYKAELVRLQTQTQVTVETEQSMTPAIDRIRSSISQLDYNKAFVQIELSSQRLITAIGQLTAIDLKNTEQSRAALAAESQVSVPILMYHKTPANFEQQLDALLAKGYNTITMLQLADYFDGRAVLPPKPAIITFDDGFSDQMEAFTLLQQRNMKATFYVIIGGEKSNWCIGIMRHNLSCGDSYLSWQQVHQLHNSGLIEIGAHTLDHSDLPTLAPSDQAEQMSKSKKTLESELNTTVTTLAYPYGKFDGTTTALAQQSGYRTAVSTIAGTEQNSRSRFVLLRVRDALLLP